MRSVKGKKNEIYEFVGNKFLYLIIVNILSFGFVGYCSVVLYL